jgi:hypothetical protein
MVVILIPNLAKTLVTQSNSCVSSNKRVQAQIQVIIT